MAFKSLVDYNNERYSNKFILQNDGDFADVIFLYRGERDVQVAEAHYIKSAEYSGYVHCNGTGCPACAKGIRVQHKLFIPLYNVTTKHVEFFDRTTRFDVQLKRDVLSRYPNPSEYVFRITRNGAANDINTQYDIRAVASNNVMTYDEILSSLNATFPEYYEHIIRDIPSFELAKMINTNSSNSGEPNLPSYQITPRSALASDMPDFDSVVGNSNIIKTPLTDITESDSDDDDLEVPFD